MFVLGCEFDIHIIFPTKTDFLAWTKIFLIKPKFFGITVEGGILKNIIDRFRITFKHNTI